MGQKKFLQPVSKTCWRAWRVEAVTAAGQHTVWTVTDGIFVKCQTCCTVRFSNGLFSVLSFNKARCNNCINLCACCETSSLDKWCRMSSSTKTLLSSSTVGCTHGRSAFLPPLLVIRPAAGAEASHVKWSETITDDPTCVEPLHAQTWEQKDHWCPEIGW